VTVFTDPLPSWPAGHSVTAAETATLFDALHALTDPWTDYSSSLVWSGTTNPVIGNGTISARYLQAGKLVIYTGSIQMGSTTTYGSGNWRVSLPVASVNTAVTHTGSALYLDLSSSDHAGSAVISGTTLLFVYIGEVTATNPQTWAAGDALSWCIIYEAI
jgi:hypothetical protein